MIRNDFKEIMVKKVCVNCSSSVRGIHKPAFISCSIREGEKVPIYGYCPLWEPNSHMLTSTILKKFQLER